MPAPLSQDLAQQVREVRKEYVNFKSPIFVSCNSQECQQLEKRLHDVDDVLQIVPPMYATISGADAVRIRPQLKTTKSPIEKIIFRETGIEVQSANSEEICFRYNGHLYAIEFFAKSDL
jgi:hypothetical protein